MRRAFVLWVLVTSFGTISARAAVGGTTSPTAEAPAKAVQSADRSVESVAARRRACDASLPKVIAGKVVLPSGCIYNRELLITKSHTRLDCNGSIFDGRNTLKIGINIDSLGKPLEDVTVENCVFRNYRTHGVLIGWSGLDASKPGDHEFLYSHTPHDIRIDHVTVSHSGHVGIYVDDYARRVTIDHAVVSGSGAPGIYFEHSSREITLRDSVVSGNGGAHREGLSIDSSAHDVVEGNTFENNTAGGVFLYRNCWEHADDPSRGSVYRWQHSDFNIIRKNIFRNEPVGVWIASRQSKDLTSMHCGDKPMDGDPRYYRDYADNNTVEGNTFCNVKVPVRVEGDRNIIRGNRFDRTNKAEVEIPMTERGLLLHLPPMGNIISGNKEITCRK